MNTIKETVSNLLQNPILIDMTYKYRNSIELSGWIIRKPKFIKHDKTGIESCSLLLFQINNTNGILKLESFQCMIYVKDIIEKLKKITCATFIVSVGKVKHHHKYGDYSQILEMEILAKTKVPLANEWGKDNEIH